MQMIASQTAIVHMKSRAACGTGNSRESAEVIFADRTTSKAFLPNADHVKRLDAWTKCERPCSAARSHKQLVSSLRPNFRISFSPTRENEGGLSCSARSC